MGQKESRLKKSFYVVMVCVGLTASMGHAFDPDRMPNAQPPGGNTEESTETYTKAYREKLREVPVKEDSRVLQRNHEKYLNTIERFDKKVR